MKKEAVYILVLFFFLSLFNSCKNSKNEPEENLIPENYIKITGKWGFEKLDFLEGVEAWPEDMKFSMDAGFGWAPMMFSGIKTFNFQTKKHSDKGVTGKVFSYATTTGHASGTTIYWVWNFKENGKSFEIEQTNKQMPPYDFSLSEAKNIVIKGNKLSFTSTMKSRLPGGSMSDDYINSKVEITLTKEKEELTPQLYIKGEAYALPE